MFCRQRGLSVLASGLLAACAITPQGRIDQEPEVFAGLSPEQQALIRAGDVAIGFDEAAAKLALGPPDRVMERTTAEGSSTIWSYYVSGPGPGYAMACHDGFPFAYRQVYCLTTPRVYEEHMRLVFQGGKLVTVERQR
jgi:hypothetical protein